jgi:hypothetical protein
MGMDLGSLISGAISGIVSPITTAITRKQELNAAQHAADLEAVKAQGERQVQLITQGLAADANWEMESLKAGKGWMRSYELVVVSIPTVLCFTPYAYIVRNGFEALQQTPIWFQGLFLMIFGANYGIRTWRRQQSDT